VATLSRTHG